MISSAIKTLHICGSQLLIGKINLFNKSMISALFGERDPLA